MSGPAPTLDQVKAAMRTAWTTGDFGRIASHMVEPSEEFVRRVLAQARLLPGAPVLDVATGTGNIAIPLARERLSVTGLDLAPNLLAQARERAQAEHLNIQFDEGDAEAMPYPDASFTLLTSMFGAMFAPRPEVASAEMARVLRPGGLLAMGNWTPRSFTGLTFRATARHAPPPPNLPVPVQWGDPATAEARLLASGFRSVRSELVAVPFDFPGSPARVVDLFRQWFGPTAAAYARLNPDGQKALTTELEQLWSEHNKASDPDRHTVVANEYLLVTAVRGD